MVHAAREIFRDYMLMFQVDSICLDPEQSLVKGAFYFHFGASLFKGKMKQISKVIL